MSNISYSVQHGIKTKFHLIGDEELLCGTSILNMDFTLGEEVLIKYGKFIANYCGTESPLLEIDYCKKCLRKAMMLENKMKNYENNKI